MAAKSAAHISKSATQGLANLAGQDAASQTTPEQGIEADDTNDDTGSNFNDHGATVAPGRVKSKQDRFKPRLSSHAVDNARERLAAYRLKHADVLDEYMRLREEVRMAAAAVGQFEHSLRTLCRDLGKVYDKARKTR